MLIRIIVHLFGGSWNLKLKCQRSTWPPARFFLLHLYHMYQSSNGASIAWNATFSGKPLFPHGINGIFISGEACVGRNCIIYQQVTVGSNALIDSPGLGAPIIGDNCFIGAGAKIIGNVHIGNNVRIGANTVVTKDVPDNSLVVSNVQRIIVKQQKPDNRFFSWHGRWICYDNGQSLAVDDNEHLKKLKSAFGK